MGERSATAPYMDICEKLSRELHVIKTALTESEATEHKLRDRITRLRRQNQELREALKPFADLATESGRAPFKLDSVDPSTTTGQSIDASPDHAQFAIRVVVGDVRRALLASQEDSTPGEAQNPISKPLG